MRLMPTVGHRKTRQAIYQMDTNLDVPGIIKRAKQALNLKRDSELAEFLGVSRATVTNWDARNSIDFRLLLDKLGNTVDYNWLLLGKGNPKHQSRFLSVS